MAETLTGQPMEEVLASIRRIIADDRSPADPAPATPPMDDVLELVPISATPTSASPAPSPALLSEEKAAASRHALGLLSGLAIDPEGPANSLDGLVREMLRPMLKTWLDTHLPEIVERMVAREIARIGGR